MTRTSRSRWKRSIGLGFLAVCAAAAPARGAVTLIEGEKGKLEMEFRFQGWAMESGPDLPFLPGLNSSPPPAQEEDITDFLVRRMRLIFRAQLPKALELYVQLGMDNIGSKVLRDDAGVRIKDAVINYKKF